MDPGTTLESGETQGPQRPKGRPGLTGPPPQSGHSSQNPVCGSPNEKRPSRQLLKQNSAFCFIELTATVKRHERVNGALIMKLSGEQETVKTQSSLEEPMRLLGNYAEPIRKSFHSRSYQGKYLDYTSSLPWLPLINSNKTWSSN